jgi:hypothetical protein
MIQTGQSIASYRNIEEITLARVFEASVFALFKYENRQIKYLEVNTW